MPPTGLSDISEAVGGNLSLLLLCCTRVQINKLLLVLNVGIFNAPFSPRRLLFSQNNDQGPLKGELINVSVINCDDRHINFTVRVNVS